MNVLNNQRNTCIVYISNDERNTKVLHKTEKTEMGVFVVVTV